MEEKTDNIIATNGKKELEIVISSKGKKKPKEKPKSKFERVVESLEFKIDSVCGGKPFVELKSICKIYGTDMTDVESLQIIKADLLAIGYLPILIGREESPRKLQVRHLDDKITRNYYLYSRYVQCYGWTKQQYKLFGWLERIKHFLRKYEFDTLSLIKKKYKLVRKGSEMAQAHKIVKVSPNDVKIFEELRTPTHYEFKRDIWDRVEKCLDECSFILNPYGGVNQRRLVWAHDFAVAFNNTYKGGKAELKEITDLLNKHSWYLVSFPNSQGRSAQKFKKVSSRKYGTKYFYLFKEHRHDELIQSSLDEVDIKLIDEKLMPLLNKICPKNPRLPQI